MDLLSEEKNLGIEVSKENINKILKEDTDKLLLYMSNNKEITNKILNITKDDFNIKIKRK